MSKIDTEGGARGCLLHSNHHVCLIINLWLGFKGNNSCIV